MTVEIIRYPTYDDWMLAKRCALVTVGKEPINAPAEDWKRAILRARHSPIRELKFVFFLGGIPYYVSTHLCRHVHAQPYVKTQRNDRQNEYDRSKAPQGAPVDMIWSMNAEELMTMANKRLCGLADETTRQLVEMICAEAVKFCPEIEPELVPMCVRNGGVCYEMKSCGRFG